MDPRCALDAFGDMHALRKGGWRQRSTPVENIALFTLADVGQAVEDTSRHRYSDSKTCLPRERDRRSFHANGVREGGKRQALDALAHAGVPAAAEYHPSFEDGCPEKRPKLLRHRHNQVGLSSGAGALGLMSATTRHVSR